MVMRWRLCGAFLLLVIAVVGVSVSVGAETADEAAAQSTEEVAAETTDEVKLATIDEVRPFLRSVKEIGCEGSLCIDVHDDEGNFAIRGDERVFEAKLGWISVFDTDNESIILAKKLSHHQATDEALLEGGVWVQQENIVISSRKARTILVEELKITFEMDVHLIRENDDGIADLEVWADRLEYDAKTNRMIAEGNVKIRTRDSVFTADRIEYDDESGELVLTGNVQGTYQGDSVSTRELRAIIGPDGEIETVEGSGRSQFVLFR